MPIDDVKRTERGWAGHFICADRCRFRRNTLLELGDTRVVVSSVGAMYQDGHDKMLNIGHDRRYETMAFYAELVNGYWEADVSREIFLKTACGLSANDVERSLTPDAIADQMHENAVTSIAMDMLHGEIENVVW